MPSTDPPTSSTPPRRGDGRKRTSPRRNGFSWAGASVLALAICLGGGWATAIVFSASSRTPPITDTTKDLLSTIGGVLAGAITAYIGGVVAVRRSKGHEKEEDDEDEQHIA